MIYNPEKHNRRSIRLKGYDYSLAGLYFITICTQDRKYLLGKIQNGEMILNDAGKMVEFIWSKIPGHFINTQLHEYIVMPNHFHAILEITAEASLVDALKPRNNQSDIGFPNIGQPQRVTPTESGIGQPQRVAPTKKPQRVTPTIKKTIGDMVGAFKSITTVEYIYGVKNLGWQAFRGKLWQRNYYERIIRNQQAYEIISNYIINNPTKWNNDKFRK